MRFSKGNIQLNSLRFVIIFISIVSCNTNKNEFEGYYYNIDKPEIYFFDKTNVELYDFSDSLLKKLNYYFDEEYISIRDKIYKSQKSNDTLLLNDVSEEKIDLRLVKFNFKPFRKSKIYNKNYKHNFEPKNSSINSSYSQEQFLRFDKNGFHFYTHFKNKKDTIYSNYYNYKGKYFDKFLFYRGFEGNLLIHGLNNNQIKALGIVRGFKASDNPIIEFKPNKIVNNLLFAKWKQTNAKDKENEYFLKNQAYINTYNEKDSVKYLLELDKVRKVFDLTNIEFNGKGNLRRSFFGKREALNHKYKFGLTSKFIVIKDFYNNSDFEILEIKKLTKNYLSFKLYNHPILYEFVRND